MYAFKSLKIHETYISSTKRIRRPIPIYNNDLISLLSATDTTTSQKITKDIEDLNNSSNQWFWIDTYKHSTKQQKYTFFQATMEHTYNAKSGEQFSGYLD